MQYRSKGLQHYTRAKRMYYTHITRSVHAVSIQKVINYCNLNKLSINMRKTNFMILTSPQKPAIHNINILDIERKTSNFENYRSLRGYKSKIFNFRNIVLFLKRTLQVADNAVLWQNVL